MTPALTLAALLALVAGVAGVLTGALRLYALRRRLIDVPGARSSHAMPTPRGGGMAIVICTLLLLPPLAALGHLPDAHAQALFGAGCAIALIGFVDDHGHVAAGWRLAVHVAAAAWVLYCVGPPHLQLAGLPPLPGWAAGGAVVLGLVWMVNLYNFMDGIDGIAGLEAVSVCLGAAALHYLGGEPRAAVLPLALAAAALGFLAWNFPRARIFMGDAGSGFLGITLGTLAVLAGGARPEMLAAWLILLGVFVADASVTLLRRLLQGERVFEAHRKHAYQHAARRLGSHVPVSLAVAAINVCWLAPLALCVGSGRLGAAAGMCIAYLPLVALALWLGAGGPPPPPSARRA